MQAVTTVKLLPGINPWVEYLKMKSEQQDVFLKKHLTEGRLSEVKMNNCSIFSNDDTFYNPKLTNGKMLYFVFSADAKKFIEAKQKIIEEQEQLPKDFFCGRIRVCDRD